MKNETPQLPGPYLIGSVLLTQHRPILGVLWWSASHGHGYTETNGFLETCMAFVYQAPSHFNALTAYKVKPKPSSGTNMGDCLYQRKRKRLGGHCLSQKTACALLALLTHTHTLKLHHPKQHWSVGEQHLCLRICPLIKHTCSLEYGCHPSETPECAPL